MPLADCARYPGLLILKDLRVIICLSSMSSETGNCTAVQSDFFWVHLSKPVYHNHLSCRSSPPESGGNNVPTTNVTPNPILPREPSPFSPKCLTKYLKFEILVMKNRVENLLSRTVQYSGVPTVITYSNFLVDHSCDSTSLITRHPERLLAWQRNDIQYVGTISLVDCR